MCFATRESVWAAFDWIAYLGNRETRVRECLHAQTTDLMISTNSTAECSIDGEAENMLLRTSCGGESILGLKRNTFFVCDEEMMWQLVNGTTTTIFSLPHSYSYFFSSIYIWMQKMGNLCIYLLIEFSSIPVNQQENRILKSIRRFFFRELIHVCVCVQRDVMLLDEDLHHLRRFSFKRRKASGVFFDFDFHFHSVIFHFPGLPDATKLLLLLLFGDLTFSPPPSFLIVFRVELFALLEGGEADDRVFPEAPVLSFDLKCGNLRVADLLIDFSIFFSFLSLCFLPDP